MKEKDPYLQAIAYAKQKCRAKTHLALRQGRINREPCSVCGNKKSEAHHPDYSKPLEIVWFCADCHRKYHVDNPVALIISKEYNKYMSIEEVIKRIDPDKTYEVSEMRRDNLFPWISSASPSSYISAIFDDKNGENLLKAKITFSGRGRRYRIKGKNIINYLEKNYAEKT